MEQDIEQVIEVVAIQHVIEVTCQSEPNSSTELLDEFIQAQQNIPKGEVHVHVPSSSDEIHPVDCFLDQVTENIKSPLPTRAETVKLEKPFKRDKPKLLDGLGYTYNVKRVRGVVTDWQCTVRSKYLTCRAIVKQQNGTFTPGPQPHLHFAEPGINAKKCKTLASRKDPQMTAKLTQAIKDKTLAGKGRKPSQKLYFSNYGFGKPKLIEKRSGHTYIFKKTKGEITHWHCTQNSKSSKCSASLKQVNGEFTTGPEPHCHEGRGNVSTKSNTMVKMSKKEKVSITKQAWDIVNAEAKLPSPFPSPEHKLSKEAYAAGFRILQAATRLSRPRLIDSKGFTYNIKRTRGTIIDWQCTIRSRKMCCLASYKEINGKFTAGSHAHAHAPEPGAGLKTRVAAKIRAKALSDLYLPTSFIVNKVLLEEVSDKQGAAALKPENLARMASRARQTSKAKFVNDILYGVAGFKPEPAAIFDDSDSESDGEN